jgi:hypothetical protein
VPFKGGSVSSLGGLKLLQQSGSSHADVQQHKGIAVPAPRKRAATFAAPSLARPCT